MLRNKFILLTIAILLSACAHTEPVIQTVIQRVEVPIPVPCKAEEPVKPEFNFDKLSPEHDIFDKTKSLLADRKLHQSYEAELLTALKSCLK